MLVSPCVAGFCSEGLASCCFLSLCGFMSEYTFAQEPPRHHLHTSILYVRVAQFWNQSRSGCENLVNFLSESLWTFTVMLGLNLALSLHSPSLVFSSTSLCLQPVIESVAAAKHVNWSQTHSQYYMDIRVCRKSVRLSTFWQLLYKSLKYLEDIFHGDYGDFSDVDISILHQ